MPIFSYQRRLKSAECLYLILLDASTRRYFQKMFRRHWLPPLQFRAAMLDYFGRKEIAALFALLALAFRYDISRIIYASQGKAPTPSRFSPQLRFQRRQ